jgi:hypothetical protein
LTEVMNMAYAQASKIQVLVLAFEKKHDEWNWKMMGFKNKWQM